MHDKLRYLILLRKGTITTNVNRIEQVEKYRATNTKGICNITEQPNF